MRGKTTPRVVLWTMELRSCHFSILAINSFYISEGEGEGAAQ